MPAGATSAADAAGLPPPQDAASTAVAASDDGERAPHSAVARRPISDASSSSQRHPVEHRADPLRDRQLDADAVREVAQHRRGRQPLDDLADLRRAPRRASRRARSARRRGGCGPSGASTCTIRSPIPARPENVSGSAPHASPSRAISTSPRVISAAFALSPSREPVDAAGRERDHVLRGARTARRRSGRC